MIKDYSLIISEEFSWKVILSFIFFELLISSLFITLDIGPFLPLLAIVFIFIYLSVRYPALWIITVILFHLLILKSSEEITVWEYFFGIYFFGGITYWFIKKLFTGSRIIAHRTDFYVLLFIGIAFASVLPALIHGTSLLKWFRELVVFISYLMYFPIREELSRKKSLIMIGIPFLILAASIAINNLIRYQSAATSAVYAWQLLSGRQTANEPMFLASIILSMALLLYVKSKMMKSLLLSILIFFAITLIFTFSRGYWIGAVTGIVILLVLIRGKHRLRMFATITLIGIIVVGIISLVFSNLSSSIMQTIVARVAAKSLSTTSDPSLIARMLETKTVMDLIISNPILGYGLGSVFGFFNPIEGHTVHTWYIHNGYLFLWFKLGISGLILFLMAYLSMIKNAYSIMKNNMNSFEGYLLAGIISLLSSMLLVSITSPQFITRDSILIIGLSWAVISTWSMSTALESRP